MNKSRILVELSTKKTIPDNSENSFLREFVRSIDRRPLNLQQPLELFLSFVCSCITKAAANNERRNVDDLTDIRILRKQVNKRASIIQYRTA